MYVCVYVCVCMCVYVCVCVCVCVICIIIPMSFFLLEVLVFHNTIDAPYNAILM